MAPVSKSTGSENTDQITHGFSLNGGHLAWAILNGKKRIENRNFRISPGWYAVCCTKMGHTGVADDRWYRTTFKDEYPGFQSFDSWKGCIVGAAYVSHNLHHQSCKDDVFACQSYPIKNIITKVVDLKVSIPCRGNFGTWPLSEEARAQLSVEIQKHLKENAIVETGAEKVYPRDAEWESKSKVKFEEYGQQPHTAIKTSKKKKKQIEDTTNKSNTFPRTIKKSTLKSRVVLPGELTLSPIPSSQQVVANSAISKNNADIRQFFEK